MAEEDFSQIDAATPIPDEDKPLLFDPVTRRYYREGETPVPRITPPTTQTVTAPPVPQVQRAPTPEQLERQRDAWFAKVTPRAAMGDPRAKAAIVAADRAMVREYVAQGKSYSEALMQARLHSGLPITLAEESTARQLSPQTQQKPIGFTLGPGMTRYQQTGTNAPVKIAEGPPKPTKPLAPTFVEHAELTEAVKARAQARADKKKPLYKDDPDFRKATDAQEAEANQTIKAFEKKYPGESVGAATNAIPTTGAAKFRVLSIEPAP